MPELKVDRVDPYDEAALCAWYAVYDEAERHGRPYAHPYSLDEVRVAAQADPVALDRILLSGTVAGEVVSTAELMLPLKDNLTRAELRLHTRPDRRREGHASRMLAHVEELLRARDRSVVTALVDHDYESGPTGEGDPGVEFLMAQGYHHALGDVQRELTLPVDPALLERLAASAAPWHGDYTLRDFSGRCPDDIVESYGRLVGMLVTEAPTGELVLEGEVFDVERVRHQEDLWREAGRTSFVTVAVTRDSEVVAYTELMVSRGSNRAFQWGTLVHPDHRGHRLGLAVKVATLARVQRERPEVRTVVTYNAESNAHMIGVNEQLGFRPVSRAAELQKELVRASAAAPN